MTLNSIETNDVEASRKVHRAPVSQPDRPAPVLHEEFMDSARAVLSQFAKQSESDEGYATPPTSPPPIPRQNEIPEAQGIKRIKVVNHLTSFYQGKLDALNNKIDDLSERLIEQDQEFSAKLDDLYQKISKICANQDSEPRNSRQQQAERSILAAQLRHHNGFGALRTGGPRPVQRQQPGDAERLEHVSHKEALADVSKDCERTYSMFEEFEQMCAIKAEEHLKRDLQAQVAQQEALASQRERNAPTEQRHHPAERGGARADHGRFAPYEARGTSHPMDYPPLPVRRQPPMFTPTWHGMAPATL